MLIKTLLLFVLLSTIFHHFLLAVETRIHRPPGNMVKVDGHQMHIYGIGEGQTTVVMTCGSGTPSACTEYSLIAPTLSRITRTCIYERPGYGWSEYALTSRDTEHIISK